MGESVYKSYPKLNPVMSATGVAKKKKKNDER